MAPHSSTLAWKIPWMEEPGRLQSMGSLRVRHDWATSLSLFTFMHWRRKWQPTPEFLPGESQGLPGGAWWAVISGVTQSQTWLKQLSSSSKPSLPKYPLNVCSTTWLRSSDDSIILRGFYAPRKKFFPIYIFPGNWSCSRDQLTIEIIFEAWALSFEIIFLNTACHCCCCC